MKENLITMKKSDAFKIFIESVKDKAKEWESILKSSENKAQLYRAQGALQMLEFVVNLPDMLIEEYEAEEGIDDDEILGI